MLKSILKNVRRPQIEFSSLQKPRKPNAYLMAPKGLCGFEPGEESPVLEIGSEDLAEAFDAVLLSMPHTEKVSDVYIGSDRQVDYVQYSAKIGFPDTITVRFLKVGPDTSTLAIFSRAHYGYRDFGVNRKRVRSLMTALKQRLG